MVAGECRSVGKVPKGELAALQHFGWPILEDSCHAPGPGMFLQASATPAFGDCVNTAGLCEEFIYGGILPSS